MAHRSEVLVTQEPGTPLHDKYANRVHQSQTVCKAQQDKLSHTELYIGMCETCQNMQCFVCGVLQMFGHLYSTHCLASWSRFSVLVRQGHLSVFCFFKRTVTTPLRT